jgi:hypothetical protein
MCYDEDSLDVSDLELGTYRFTAECDFEGNASMPLLTGNYTFDIKPLSLATTTIAPSGLTANAVALATSNASVYWGNWLLENVYLVAGLFFAVVLLVIFLVLSAEFNMPILATAGFVIAAFIALVTLILTSPAGLLILIVIVLLLLVIGAFAIFKGMSA